MRMPLRWKEAMDDDLVCNFKKCRKRITNVAWVSRVAYAFQLLTFLPFQVTSCSRILVSLSLSLAIQYCMHWVP